MILKLFPFAKKAMYFQEILELFCLSFKAFLLHEKTRKRLSGEFSRPKSTSMGAFKHQEITYEQWRSVNIYNGYSLLHEGCGWAWHGGGGDRRGSMKLGFMVWFSARVDKNLVTGYTIEMLFG